MPLSHLARTHLVYQSLILALVLSTCHDFLPKVAMFLIVLLYQMLILVLCCTEIIPVPRWMNLGYDLLAANNSQEQRSDGSLSKEGCGVEKRANEVPQMSLELNNLNRGKQDANVCARKYILRNCKSPSSDTSALKHPVSVLPLDASSGIPLERTNPNQIISPESTKKYFFPYRQKRLEQWIEPKENQRPYKIRNWQSNSSIGQQSAMSSSDITNFTSSKNILDSSDPDGQCPSFPKNRNGFPHNHKHSINSDTGGTGNDCLSIDSPVPEELPVIPELLKRYTFPFRQKSSNDSDNDELDRSGDYPSTPYWKTVGYSMAVKQEARKRRRSVSSSLLATRKFDHGNESDKFKDFSQSVEITRPSVNDSKFNSSLNTTGSSTFAKMKLNFVNCFSKMKRVNSKNNLNKGIGTKRRSFKSLFQSRENINLESNENGTALKSDIGIEKPSSDFYPSYIPFQKERFEKDVRKRMLELPQT
ncbi:hypothetical protein JTE90_002786 [Oedothorax gibbosus]|uniref:Uncharacterized protein n=1 Tax=Oedothorax gibbosus TaxID=931172 RepID=A0AAV6UK95_9ARAC|nr:hypothetical protein JTE90_002786 [Oedothorax gibbosus]